MSNVKREGVKARNIAKFRAYVETHPLGSTYDKIQAALGFSPPTIAEYFKQCPDLRDKIHESCQEIFKSMEQTALDRLTDMVINGDKWAVQYVLDNRGYKPADKVQVEASKISINIEE